jgi:hypothetical protein
MLKNDNECLNIKSENKQRTSKARTIQPKRTSNRKAQQQPHATSAMNSVVSNQTNLREYHTVENAEFSGVYKQSYWHVDKIFYSNRREIKEFYKINKFYHLFIKYGNKIYMEVESVGSVVIPFDELQKNQYWKQFYELSLLLTNDKHVVIKNHRTYNELSKNKPFEDLQKMCKCKYWTIDTAYIEEKNFVKDDVLIDKQNVIIPSGNVCHYDINPFDLEKMEYTSPEKLKIFEDNYKNLFLNIYMLRYEITDEKIFTERFTEKMTECKMFAIHMAKKRIKVA